MPDPRWASRLGSQRNAPQRGTLREAAPILKVELFGFKQLGQIAFKHGPLGHQSKNLRLVENIYMVFPDHVVDRRQSLPVAHQRGREDGGTIAH